MDPIAPPGRFRRPLLFAVALAVILALPAACTAWFFFVVPVDPAPYLATIDALPVPPTWQNVHTQTLRDPLIGSRADRYYFVDAEPEDIAPVVQDVLRSAGLEIYTREASKDWCDTRPIGATPAIVCPRKETETCRENGSGGSVSCTVIAFRWLSLDPPLLERLFVGVSPRGDVFDVGVNNDHRRVEASNRALVVISAERVTARTFWSSPTPRAP
jgi:hypothetical protein